MVQIVVVEGLIGAGKSTLLRQLKDRLGDAVVVVQEPVDRWESCEGHNLLAAFYADPERTSLAFQTFVLATRRRALLEAVAEARRTGARAVVLERGFEGDACFAEATLPEPWFAAYRVVAAELRLDLGDDVRCVFLDVDPETATRRARSRGRASEGSKVTVEYQERLWDLLKRRLPGDRLELPWCPSTRKDTLDRVLSFLR